MADYPIWELNWTERVAGKDQECTAFCYDEEGVKEQVETIMADSPDITLVRVRKIEEELWYQLLMDDDDNLFIDVSSAPFG